MKKNFLVFIAAVLSIAACNNDKTPASEDKKMSDEKMSSSTEDKEERNKKTALASIDGVNKHDADAVLKDAASDMVDYGDQDTPRAKGIDSTKAGLSNWLHAFPDVKGDNLQAVADGDWVVVWGDWSGTFKNDFMGMKATGKSYKTKEADIFKFNDDGKITEHRSLSTGEAEMNQVMDKKK